MSIKQYRSPIDGTTLLVLPTDPVSYRDRSTGTEYSLEYVKANFDEVKQAKKQSRKKEAPVEEELLPEDVEQEDIDAAIADGEERDEEQTLES